MIGSGRETKKENDLFYTCSLIDYIARKTKNIRADVVNQLGKRNLNKIYDLADVYHCDNIDRVSEESSWVTFACKHYNSRTTLRRFRSI